MNNLICRVVQPWEIAIIVIAIVTVIIIAGILLADRIRENKAKKEYEKNYLIEQKFERLKKYTIYIKKDSLLTNCEKECFIKIKEATKETRFIVYPQINLASIIEKSKFGYANELFRNIDFGLFDGYTLEPILMIELNDKSHLREDRIERDQKVSDILEMAKIPLLTLYTTEKLTTEIIKNKIFQTLNQHNIAY